MKLASFRYNGQDSIGVAFDNDTIVDLAHVAPLIGVDTMPSDMISLIEKGDAGRTMVHSAYHFARAHVKEVTPIPQGLVQWHPPVRRPAKICGIAMNNSSSNSRKISAPDHPLFFLKPASCLIGH